jgi:hypothetical protein
MNTAIMANPSNTSTAGSFSCEQHHNGVMRDTDVIVASVTAVPLVQLIGILLIGSIVLILLTHAATGQLPV